MQRTVEGHSRLKTSTLLLYGLPNLSLSVAQLPIGIYLNDLYTTVLAVPLGMVGLAIFLSRCTDVITDPIIGSLSDNWKAPFGRRKFWILIGTPLMVVSLWFLFVPPPGVGAWYLFLMVSLFFLANTMIDLPYRAWGADLSKDYRERSRVTGIREMYGLFGNVLVFVVPIGLGLYGLTRITDWTMGIAILTAVCLPLFIAVAVSMVHEPTREELHAEPVNWWRGLAAVTSNGPFLRLVFMGVIFTVTVGVTTATSLYFVDHVMASREIYPRVLLAYFLCSILAIPLWMRVAHRYGKHKAVALAIIVLALGSAPMPFIAAGDFWVFVAFMLIKGAAIGALLFIPVSMAADVVDLDTSRTGRQRTGLFFALWGMALKFAAGVALLITGIIGLSGFDSGCSSPSRAEILLRQEAAAGVRAANPGASRAELAPKIAEAQKAALTPERIEAVRAADPAALQRLADAKVLQRPCVNSAESIFVLALFYSWIPALISLIAWPFMWSYPLTEQRQKELRAEIEARKKTAGAAAAG